MKKSKIKSLLLLLLCGIVYLTFAVGSSSSNTTTTSSPGTTTQSKTSEISKYKLNEDIYITNSKGKYRLKFTNVSETSDRNEFSDTVADRVIIIEYEYENISQEGDLFISSSEFNLYDKDNNKMETYPATGTKYPTNVGTGRKTTASLAFALNNSSNYIELDYYDNMFNNKPDCRVILEW